MSPSASMRSRWHCSLCDGTRDRDALAAAALIGGDAQRRAHLDETLAMFARFALLEAR